MKPSGSLSFFLSALPPTPPPLYCICRDSVCDKRERDGLSDLHLGENGGSVRPSPMPTRRWNGGGKNASHGPARKSSPPSPIPTPFMLFPSSIYYVSRRRDDRDRRFPQTPIVPIDVEFWQNNSAFIPIVLLFDRAEATFSCRLSRVSGPFTFLLLRRWHGSITYLPFTRRKKEWTKTASASESRGRKRKLRHSRYVL